MEQRERRRYERVGAKNPERPVTTARYYHLSDARKTVRMAPVLDVSLGGLCLHTEEELPIGATIQVLLEPSHPPGVEATMGGAYRLLAEVRWAAAGDQDSAQYLSGLEFLPISTAESRNIRGLEQIMTSYSKHEGSA